MSLSETIQGVETKLSALIALIFALLFSSTASAQNLLSLYPKDSSKSALTIYVLEFSLEQSVPSDASFSFTFSEGFDVSLVEVAGSSNINGGFKLSVKDNQVIIDRTGLGDALPAGEKANLKFALVKNPDAAGENYSATVKISAPDVGTIITKTIQIKIK